MEGQAVVRPVRKFFWVASRLKIRENKYKYVCIGNILKIGPVPHTMKYVKIPSISENPGGPFSTMVCSFVGSIYVCIKIEIKLYKDIEI